ncbi:hypothetical protein [Streptomyces sp. TP-A0356]|uniref:hypothetical protein n=1 Tax=Streptomyces sp. TP-A0356 TaxID=1359208 RepID=UPI0006E1BEA2|nr:hypothetical protein [Streptomyces sp. TP-A0356]
MAERYPLVEQREYGPPEKRGGWLNRRAMREADELPRLAAHHVRVFRVGEQYVEDQGHLRPDDPVVVEAGSVTVVDRRVEVPVVVETRIPSAEAGDFTVRVTFYCTVTDACAVVRDGITDVEALLLSHLRRVPGLTEDGGDRPIVESAAVRDRISARLTAYHEMHPPVVSGLRARSGLVEVLTPEELAAHLKQIQDARRARELDRELEDLKQQRALDKALAEAELELKQEEIRNLNARLKERNRQEEELSKERNRQEYETLRTHYEFGAGTERQRHDLTLEAERNHFVRDQLAADFEVIGSDPLAADFNAWRNGDITADQLAGRLREAEQYRDQKQTERARLEREEQLKQRAFAREDQRWQVERDEKRLALTRQAERDEAAARQQEQSRRWDLEREDRLRQRQENREDAQRLQHDQREWRREQLAAKVGLSKQVIDRGLIDSTMYDAGAFINNVGDIPYTQAQPLRQGGERELQKGELQRIPQPAKEGDAVEYDGGDDGDLDLGGTDSEASLGH